MLQSGHIMRDGRTDRNQYTPQQLCCAGGGGGGGGGGGIIKKYVLLNIQAC